MDDNIVAPNTFLRDLEKDPIITLKRKIDDILKADDDIIKLLKDRNGITPLYANGESMQYDGIYPFVFVPEVQSQDKCYICYKVDYELVETSKKFNITHIVTFVTFCSVQKQDTGMRCNRVDAIAFCIRDLFQGHNPHGFTWDLIEDEESVLTTGYIARTLQFRYKNPNRVPNTTFRDKGGHLAKIEHDVNDAIITNRNGTVIYTDPDE